MKTRVTVTVDVTIEHTSAEALQEIMDDLRRHGPPHEWQSGVSTLGAYHIQALRPCVVKRKRGRE